MRKLWGIALRWASISSFVLGLGIAVSAGAEESLDDRAAREQFERGRVAFDEADYEAALLYFQHAYRLSRRSELQYNIGVAADRLQREEQALDAFERYLAETENPAREAEVLERISALRQSIAEREATRRALQEATVRYQTAEPEAQDQPGRVPRSAIAGSSALAAVGIAGVVAMGVGLAKDGTCKREAGGRCVVEHSATAWTWVYGGLGIAALAGSATWLAVSVKRSKREPKTQISIAPGSLMVSRKF